MELSNLPQLENIRGWTGFLPALVQTWFGACFRPREFFCLVGNSQKLGRALLFSVLIGWISVGLSPLVGQEAPVVKLQSPGRTHEKPALQSGWEATAGERHTERHASFPLPKWFIALVRNLLGVFGGVFVGGLILHLMLKISGGASQGVSMTLRVICYCYAPAIFAVLPWVGTFIAGVWMLLLAIIGLAAAHRTTPWRAALAVLCPVVPILVLLLLTKGIHVHLGHLAGFDLRMGSAGHSQVREEW